MQAIKKDNFIIIRISSSHYHRISRSHQVHTVAVGWAWEQHQFVIVFEYAFRGCLNPLEFPLQVSYQSQAESKKVVTERAHNFQKVKNWIRKGCHTAIKLSNSIFATSAWILMAPWRSNTFARAKRGQGPFSFWRRIETFRPWKVIFFVEYTADDILPADRTGTVIFQYVLAGLQRYYYDKLVYYLGQLYILYKKVKK